MNKKQYIGGLKPFDKKVIKINQMNPNIFKNFENKN